MLQNFCIYRFIYLVFLLVLVGGCGGNPDSGTEEMENLASNTTEISGQVLDSSGKPIAGAKVEFHSDPVIVYTDSQGKYQVTLEKGSHHVKISIPIISADESTVIGEYILFEKNFNTTPSTQDDSLKEIIGDSETPLDNDYFEGGVLCLKDSDGDGYSDAASIGISVDGDSCSIAGYFDSNSTHWKSVSSDCNDLENTINPGADEVYDGIDNNCLNGIDENFNAYYADTDGDGYGVETAVYYDSPTAGYVTNNTDCDDTEVSVNPGEVEVYDGVDNNCTSGIDENFIAYYADTDGDGYGAGTAVYYDVPTAGYVTNATDCDAANAAVNPGTAEAYDGIDNNCLDGIDENFIAYYADTDGDGYGAGTAVYYDVPTAGYVTNATDCDAANAAVNPGTAEAYDGIDNNCLDGIDENFIAYYADTDGDGYGAGTAVYYDAPTAGYVTNATDCDDTNGAVNPGVAEVYDSVDNNCASGIDENFIAYYADGDSDGYGAGVAVYYDAPEAGYVTNDTDCEDANDAIYPGAMEIADGVDNDCDGTEVICTYSATILPGASGVLELTQ